MTEPKFVPSRDWEWDSNYRIATLDTPNGRFRAKIERDENASEPEFDAGCPIVQLDYSRNSFTTRMVGYGDESAANDGLPRPADEILDLFAGDSGDMRTAIDRFERYIKVFHGGTIVEYGPNQGVGYTYVAYTTLKMVTELWGNTDSEGINANMDEWISYLEGDVYGVMVERHIAVLDKDGLDFARETLGESSSYDQVVELASQRAEVALGEGYGEWVDCEGDGSACWGFFGEGYAKESAESALKSEIENAKEN